MSRLILSGIFDRLPRLRILTHHGGDVLPHFAGRTIASIEAIDLSIVPV